MRRTWLLSFVAVVCAASVSLTACNRAEKQREALREELDAEFEADMAKTLGVAHDLSVLVEDLAHEHDRNDKRHAELDELLAGVDLDDEDRAVQAKHAAWETEHRALIDDARHQIERFDESHGRHEAAEAAHADVPLDQIREEHEQFERELIYFEEKLASMTQDLEAAQQQMVTVFADHDAMQAKYGK
jgi:chromosome segregation ATPase